MPDEDLKTDEELVPDDGEDSDEKIVFEHNKKYILGEGLFCYAFPHLSFVNENENAVIIKLTIIDDSEPPQIVLDSFCSVFIAIGMISNLSAAAKSGLEGINTTAGRRLSTPGSKELNLKMIRGCIEDLEMIYDSINKAME